MAMLLCSRKEERRLERARVVKRLAGIGSQCGLPPAELLSAVAVVVAGRHQGGLSRPGEHRRALRQGGAQPVDRDEAAERGFAENLRAAFDPSGLHPVQRFYARQVRVPVLRHARRPHVRPSAAALARRPYHLGQRGRLLLRLQSQEGQSDARGIRDVADADAVPAERASPASQRPAVSAELPARELARLSLLGFGTRAVISEVSCPAQAGHPVINDACWVTGSAACAATTRQRQAGRRLLAAPQIAIAASVSEISTLYPASERPRKRHGASSQRTTVTFCNCFIRSEARPRLVTGPAQSAC